MKISQLIELAQRAWSERPTILGLPGGDLSPEEMAAAAKGMKEGMGMGGGFPGMPRGLSLPSCLSGLMKKK